MNDNYTREMSFNESASMLISEVEARIKEINDNNGDTSNEMLLLISAMYCVKKGLCEIDDLKSDCEQLDNMYHKQLAVNEENKKQNEIMIKVLCDFICRGTK
jgi:hypothetical protein